MQFDARPDLLRFIVRLVDPFFIYCTQLFFNIV